MTAAAPPPPLRPWSGPQASPPDPLADERALFERHRRHPDPEVRAQLVERFLPLARHLALRHRHAGNAHEDVFQVACLALVKAVDRFEPARGVAFSSYAVPTILGEMKRFFRDQTWAVHVPRELQERSLRAERAVGELSAQSGRQPTVSEVAACVGCTDDDVLEAFEVAAAYRATSLDAPQHADDDKLRVLAEAIGRDDQRLAAVEERADLSTLIALLSARERAALWLRFERDLTQSQIAAELGVSQMQVSRILRQALERLRRLARDRLGDAPA